MKQIIKIIVKYVNKVEKLFFVIHVQKHIILFVLIPNLNKHLKVIGHVQNVRKME